MTKVRFFEQSGERQYARAQRIWQVLVGYVMFKQDQSGMGKGIITYGDLAELLGYDRRAAVTLGAPLGYIHRFCEQNDLPHLNAIVVREDTGIAGWDEMYPDRKRHLEEQKKFGILTGSVSESRRPGHLKTIRTNLKAPM